MKLGNIKISGYKSIEELEFPIKKYGASKSYTTILLGKNETGKSNVLEAMASPLKAENAEPVNFIKIKNQQKEPKLVSIFYTFDIEDGDVLTDKLSEYVDIPDELAESLQVTQIIKEVYLQDEMTEFGTDYEVKFKKIGVKKYSYLEAEVNIPAQPTTPPTPETTTTQYTVKSNSSLSEEEQASYTKLDDEKFGEIVKQAMQDVAESIPVPVDAWKSEDKYLIQDKIMLSDFVTNPEDNIPLKNMFYLAGYETKKAIKDVVAEIEKDDNKRRKLSKRFRQKQRNTSMKNGKSTRLA
jgi:AAA15 family ATPase/GTPase